MMMRTFVFVCALFAGFFTVITYAQENPLLNPDFWKTATIQDVKTALDSGANIHARIDNGMVPLHFAAAFSKIPETLALLLKQGADIEARETTNSTALHIAAGWSDTPEVVALLLERGANTEARDQNGWTPLHIATRNSKPRIVALLLKRGADVMARSEDGLTPLHRAAVTSNTPKVVALLLDHGADIEAREHNSGWTPLQLAAAASKTPETIVLLLRRGANTKVYDRNGKTPFDYVKENEYLREVKILRNLDIRQNVMPQDSWEITTPEVHYNRCEISIGDKVIFRDPVEIYALMHDMQLTKDEFETTEAFENRVAEATSAFSEPILLRGTYDREQTNYDADNSHIVMKRYAWDNLGFGWNDVFGYENDYGIKANLTDNHATTLQSNERVTGTFIGSNAYGASMEVTQILRTSYGIFDRANDSRKETWEGEVWVGKHASPAVLIPMSVDEARRVISKLQVGILAKPRKPFVAEGKRHWDAKVDNPKEVTAKYYVIVADMICAVITDDQGRVLKTVATTY